MACLWICSARLFWLPPLLAFRFMNFQLKHMLFFIWLCCSRKHMFCSGTASFCATRGAKPSRATKLLEGSMTKTSVHGLGPLPAPEASRAALSAEYVAPKTPLERAFAAVWAEVLGAPRVGLADNFFELGGHSILAVRLAARLAETLGVEVGLRALFDAPTPGELLARLRESGAAQLAEAEALLAGLERLSDEEVEAALAAERTAGGAGAA
jgi:hypothetical protein